MYKYNLQEDNHQDYCSDDDEDLRIKPKLKNTDQKAGRFIANNKIDMQLQQHHLFKVIKQRGLELEENQLNKLRSSKIAKPLSSLSSNKENSNISGNSDLLKQGILEQLVNSSLQSTDPSQVIKLINQMLQNKTIDQQRKNIYRLKRLQLYANQQDYQKCQTQALALVNNNSTMNQLTFAMISNLLARARLQLPKKAWMGYMDLERAKSLIRPFRIKKEQLIYTTKKNDDSEFKDSEIDQILRNIQETQLNFNARFLQETQIYHMLYPHFNCFRNRQILSVSSGDFHTLILVGRPLYTPTSIDENTQKWQTEIFGIGQNFVGQIDGSSSQYLSEPVLINKLSGKKISGIYAYRESSLAFDRQGNVYEWGVSNFQNSRQIQVKMSLQQPIKKIQRGNMFYCALTTTNKFFLWGYIGDQSTQLEILNEKNPKQFFILNSENKTQSIVDFSCGSNHIIIITQTGKVFGFGKNESGQLPIQNQKNYYDKIRQLQVSSIIKRIFAIQDCTFLFTNENELLFCGRYSSKKSPQLQLRHIEFSHDVFEIISMCGDLGSYSLTSEKGQIYRWDADSNLYRFRLEKGTTSRFRVLESTKSMQFKMNTIPTNIQIKSLSEKIYQDEDICFQIQMRDRFGSYNMKIEPNIPSIYKVYLGEQSQEKQSLLAQQPFEISENRIIIKPVKPGHYKIHFQMTIPQLQQTYYCTTTQTVLAKFKNLLQIQISKNEYEDFQF